MLFEADIELEKTFGKRYNVEQAPLACTNTAEGGCST
jgi:hypothetical protein